LPETTEHTVEFGGLLGLYPRRCMRSQGVGKVPRTGSDKTRVKRSRSTEHDRLTNRRGQEAAREKAHCGKTRDKKGGPNVARQEGGKGC
jgi:hypothetical protein